MKARVSDSFGDPAARRRLVDLLAEGARTLDVALPSGAADRLIDYLALLHKWNAAYSLTAIQGGEQMVIRLLLDSLSVVPYIKGPRVLDLGSGPGLPGIPLALVHTGYHFVLLDSGLKKVRFLRQAVGELRLANVAVEQGRAQDYRPERPFDTVVVRAFAALADIVDAAGHLCAQDGYICAMKGRYPGAELDALPPHCRVEAVERLKVPGLDAERYLVRLGVSKPMITLHK